MQLLPAALNGGAPGARPHSPRRTWCRTGARMATIAALLASLCGSGCASMAQTMLAPRDEYQAYRHVRTQAQLEPRLAAAWSYVQRYPQGRWIAEVRPWFLRAELKYFELHRQSAAGLRAYLTVLPDGPHADEARASLEVYRARARKDHQERLGLEARYTEARLAALALQREQARNAVPTWLGRFFQIDTWGERTSHLASEMLYEWRIAPPGARCVGDICTRTESLPFSLPGGGDDAARLMVLDVVLVLDNGGVSEARLQGPGLFSRLYEASTTNRVAADAPSARVDAIAFAVDVVRGAAEARMPSSRCARDPVAPVVLSLACDGWSLEMRAAATPEQDDQIVVRGPRKP